MADVVITGDARFERIEKAYQDLSKENIKLRTSMGKVVDKNKQLESGFKRTNKAAGGFDKVAANIGRMVLAYASVTVAVRAVNAALEDQKRLQRESFEANISTAGADAQLIKNLQGFSTETKKGVFESVRAIAKDTQVSETVLKVAMSSAVSKAEGNIGMALTATRLAAQMGRAEQESIKPLASASVSLANISGGEVDAMMGLVLSAQAQAPQTTTGDVARALPRLIATGIGSVGAEAGTQEALLASQGSAALFSAFGSATQIERGEPVATAGIQFISQLRNEFIGKEDDPGTIRGRIAAIQQQYKETGELPQFTGESAFRIPFESLLKGEGKVSESFARNIGGGVSADIGAVKQTIRELETLTPALRLANQKSATASREEQHQLEGAGTLGSIEAARESLAVTADAVDPSIAGFASRKVASLAFEVVQNATGEAGTAVEAGIAAQRVRFRDILSSAFIPAALAPASLSGKLLPLSEAGKEGLKEAQSIREMQNSVQGEQAGDTRVQSEHLQGILDEMKKLNAAGWAFPNDQRASQLEEARSQQE